MMQFSQFPPVAVAGSTTLANWQYKINTEKEGSREYRVAQVVVENLLLSFICDVPPSLGSRQLQ